jgi:cell pole-organizing protein PopZ
LLHHGVTNVAMTDSPATLDAILASIRARVMSPGEDAEEEAPPVVETQPPVPLEDVEMTPSTASMTLDQLIRSLLASHVQAWLDANMPEIVEKLAREEIRRLTGKL